ncbi:Bacterial Transmembrane Pair family protein [compost metagenome]
MLSLVLDKSLAHMGALTLMFSTVAMLWNMLFNSLFDRAQRSLGFQRTLPVRLAHAVLFELGLIVALVPLAAWWLSIGLVEAFLLDIGLLLFFLPYTLAFNWTYDTLRARLLDTRSKATTGCGAR